MAAQGPRKQLFPGALWSACRVSLRKLLLPTYVFRVGCNKSQITSRVIYTFLDVSDVFVPDGRFEDLGTIDKRYSLSVDVVIPFWT